jgi:hypothetical protein
MTVRRPWSAPRFVPFHRNAATQIHPLPAYRARMCGSYYTLGFDFMQPPAKVCRRHAFNVQYPILVIRARCHVPQAKPLRQY